MNWVDRAMDAVFSGWFGDWGWIVWILVGGLGYFVCSLFGDDLSDPNVSPMAVVGSCALGPIMLLVAYVIYAAKRSQ